MKKYIKTSLFCKMLSLVAALTAFFACNDELPGKYEMTDGLPVVHYVRYQSNDYAGQLLDGAYMKENVIIIGDNLTSVREVWFNNVKALLNINLISANAIFVSVPGDLPSERTDKLYLVTGKYDTVAYDFQVKIPAPVIARIKCEQVPEGGDVVLYGDYFLATDASALKIYVGDYEVPTADIVSYEKTELVFKAPPADVKGAIEVRTLYGNSGRTKDIFHDDRGLITGFEDGFVAGWGRPDSRNIQNDPEYAISGNYVRIHSTTIGIDGSWVGGSVIINIWGEDNGVPTGNLFSSDPATSTFKFEANVLETWSAGPMIFCFEAQGQMENYLWADGTQPRGVWVPWQETGSYTSDGWVTVSIPLSEFKYNGAGDTVPLATEFGSLGIAIHNRGNDAWTGTAECTPVILLDNIRVIP
jgi:hypothetical protein